MSGLNRTPMRVGDQLLGLGAREHRAGAPLGIAVDQGPELALREDARRLLDVPAIAASRNSAESTEYVL